MPPWNSEEIIMLGRDCLKSCFILTTIKKELKIILLLLPLLESYLFDEILDSNEIFTLSLLRCFLAYKFNYNFKAALIEIKFTNELFEYIGVNWLFNLIILKT